MNGAMQHPLLQHMVDHHRIPSILPEPPSSVERRASTSATTPTAQEIYQSQLLANYLAMLASKTETSAAQTGEIDRQVIEGIVKSRLGQGMSSSKGLHPMTMADLVTHHRRSQNPHSSAPSTSTAPTTASPPDIRHATLQPALPRSIPTPLHQHQQLLAPPPPQITRTEYLTSPFENGFDFNTSPMLSDAVSPYSPYANKFATSPHLSDTSPLPGYIENTSPLMDTPLLSFDDEFEFNTGPVEDSPLTPDLNTPVIEGHDDAIMDAYTNGLSALFDDQATGMYEQIEEINVTEKGKGKQNVKVKEETSTPDTKPLSAFPQHAPLLPSSATMSTRSAARHSSSTIPTGTRRNVTPHSLIPYDAPTQTRRYIIPSSTSRKELPLGFARKRRRVNSASCVNPDLASGEDELDEPLEPLRLNATEMEAIEHKRRQNTLAARKSRKRKLEHLLQLEDDNAELKEEVESWKARAEMLASMVKAYGIADVDVENLY
ncbi:hypothetical protein V5O48_000376 [Marasmius crinis-equi]|uniref:BZIP domain-containing protein n=1 Tax=Marasmius crinis-equi TaxID=585013 RepID=A0ABR3G1F1_9AGAR